MIIVCSILGVLLVATLLYFLIRRRRQDRVKILNDSMSRFNNKDMVELRCTPAQMLTEQDFYKAKDNGCAVDATNNEINGNSNPSIDNSVESNQKKEKDN